MLFRKKFDEYIMKNSYETSLYSSGFQVVAAIPMTDLSPNECYNS